ncbi:MAG: TIGR00341 family protein [Pseudomonadota bacterium]|nr:TIGR00341 family protein [Pseudomonadota bacterium]
MALRLLELKLPAADADLLAELLDDVQVQDVSHLPVEDGHRLVRILIDAHDTEAVLDRVTARFGSRESFRLVLLPVEATLPAPVQPELPPASATPGAEKEPVRVGFKRISREELYEDIFAASKLTGTYALMVAVSTIVAAVGLLRDDTAVVIGAMVIAPLLGPNISLAVAATLGDARLAVSSLKAIAAGVSTAALLSLLAGTVVDVHPGMPELLMRTRPRFGDILLALASGTAGALAFTSAVPGVVVGVMVAVALLPPLVVAGLFAGSGHLQPAVGALILAATNVTCINLAAVATFFLQGVRPRVWWETKRARRATRIAGGVWIAMLLLLAGLMRLVRPVP